MISSSSEAALVVLNLSHSALTEDFIQWHWQPIAGVPFLLRNLLSVQRSGAAKAVVYLGPHPEAAKALADKLRDESRLRFKWKLLAENFIPAEAANLGKRILVLDGQTLHDSSDISQALARLRQTSGETPVEFLPETPQNSLSKEEDFFIQEERLLRTGGGLGNDSLITRYLSRTVSTRLTRLLIDTSLTPNQVTLFSFFFGLLSVGLFLKGDYWPGVVGGALLVFSTWADGVDGELARLKFMESKLGAKLDIYCDNIVHFFLFLAIGLGLANTTGQKLYASLGAIAAIGSLLSFFMLNALVTASKSSAARSAEKNSGRTKTKPNFAEKIANRDFIHLLFLLTLFGRVDIFLWLTALGVTAFTLYLLYQRLKIRLT